MTAYVEKMLHEILRSTKMAYAIFERKSVLNIDRK